MKQFYLTKKLLSAALAGAMVVSLTACGGNASSPATSAAGGGDKAAQSAEAGTSGEPKYKRDIVMTYDVNIDSSDPQAFNNPQHKRLYMLTHTPLLVYNPETLELLPGAAESWEVADDLVTWTFHLRQGMMFHNGEELKADDVVFTWERGTESSYSAIQPQFAAAKLEAKDDYTVVLTLEDANMDYAYIISQPSFGILNRKAFQDSPDRGYNVGTGAFKLKELVESDYCVVERFDGFWDGLVPTEEITFKTMLEPSAALIALQNGEVDICVKVNTEEYGIVEADPTIDLIRFTGGSLNYLAVNASKAPTDNVKLRQAIACAINIDEIIAGAEGGEGERAKTFWGWNQFGYNDKVQPYEQNVEKAKELMKEAGYENGLNLEVVAFATNYVRISEIMQAQLAEIGITLSVKQMDFSAATEYSTSRQHEMMLIGFSNNPYGDDSRRSHTPGIASNRSAMDNAEIMELFDQAQQETDEAKRIEAYCRIQEITHEEAAAIPLYFNKIGMATRKGLHDMWIEPGNCHNLTYAYITLAE